MKQNLNLERLLLPSVLELLRNAELVGDLEFLYATVTSSRHKREKADLNEVKDMYMDSLITKYKTIYDFENTDIIKSAYNSLIKGRRKPQCVTI